MKTPAVAILITVLLARAAWAQDQQLGARTKAMGGSYTAFEDDPVSIWLNPAGISTQLTSMSVAYQTYTTYPIHQETPPGSTTPSVSAGAETTFVEPALLPSYVGFVFHVGPADSGMAVGICYARPYVLSYSFDRVSDPTQSTFEADSNMEQSFSRFRLAFAKDFRIAEPGQAGFFTHISGGVGLDIGFERWEFKSSLPDGTSASDNATAFGFGLGFLVCVYDDTEYFKVNLGAAWQSPIHWDFSIDPDVAPAFDMPQQLNVGTTFYLLKGAPLRVTVDFQWIEWSKTAEDPLFDGKKKFDNAFNYSFGVEYRLDLGGKVNLYPRAGYRRFDAPWNDKNNLPMTSNYQLVLDTKAGAFNIVTFGFGLSWSSDEGKVRSVDVAVDTGGDAYNLAFGFGFEF